MAADYDNCRVVELFFFINIFVAFLINIGLKITPTILMIIITLLSIIAFIHATYANINDSLQTAGDTINRDTIKYKLLKYIDFTKRLLDGKPIQEPVYAIFTTKRVLNAMLYMYITVFIIFVCLGIIILFVMYAPLVIDGFKSDSDKFNVAELKQMFSTDIVIAMFFALMIFLVYKTFYTMYLHVKLEKMKSAIDALDYYILNQINILGNTMETQHTSGETKTVGTIDKTFYKILMNKTKDNFLTDDLILENIKKEPNTNIKIQKTFIYALYLHLYDNIPSTNVRALKMVQEFFFDTDETNLTTQNISDAEKVRISFTSLFPKNNDIYAIDKSLYKKLITDLEIIQGVDERLDEINIKLQDISIADTGNIADEFAILALIVMIVAIAVFVFYIYTLTHLGSSEDLKNYLKPFMEFIQKQVSRVF